MEVPQYRLSAFAVPERIIDTFQGLVQSIYAVHRSFKQVLSRQFVGDRLNVLQRRFQTSEVDRGGPVSLDS